MNFLVTGSAGFIGYHVSLSLAEKGHRVLGFDNLNDYYDVNLKLARLELLKSFPNFSFLKGDVADESALKLAFDSSTFDRVIHLAAQAGVRYSVKNPKAYVHSNLVGFSNVLEACRTAKTPHLVYASSSSVYGMNSKVPFSANDAVDHPVSLYAATKRSNELMAHAYSHIHGLPVTGLRFFTVYGPWGRPDMAYFKFAKAIAKGDPIEVYGDGSMSRDFTFIDDIVEGVVRIADKIPQSAEKSGELKPSESFAPFKVYNIGNHSPVKVLEFVKILEAAMGKRAVIKFAPVQQGEVETTFADVSELVRDVGFAPSTDIRDGLAKFVGWFNQYYNNKN